jgi:hypothetical protein
MYSVDFLLRLPERQGAVPVLSIGDSTPESSLAAAAALRTLTQSRVLMRDGAASRHIA